MSYKTGRDMGFVSKHVTKIFRELKKGNKNYKKDCILCLSKKCRSGYVINNITKEEDECKLCKGYGFIRKV